MLVIGGGAAGLVTTAGAAALGARVALVERERMGGECLWTGCVPSKALIACARAAHEAREAARFGVDAGPVRVDFRRVMEWVGEAQRRIEPHDSPERFRRMGVEVAEGSARFVGVRVVDVGGRRLSARAVVIATGSAPAAPAVPGLEDVPYLTNETIFELDALPRSLLVLGGGPIGVELAQAFARLGSAVTLVEAAPRLLPLEDDDVSAALRTILTAEGVTVLPEHRATRAERASDGVALQLEGPAGASRVDAEAILVAAGRRPRVDGLEPGAAGVEVSDRGVVVDDRLRTTAEGVWAAGDVTGILRFTHVADYQARMVLRNALFPLSSRANYAAVPWAIFTDPQIGRVGLTEAEARARHGDAVQLWRRPLVALDRAVADGRTTGFVKLVADRRGRLLGAHVVGHGADTMVAELALALRHGLGVRQLAGTIHAYPTYPEAVRQAAEERTRARFTGLSRSIARWFATH